MHSMYKIRTIVILCAALTISGVAFAQQKEIPELLKPWEGWATWGDKHRDCPTPYDGSTAHFCIWPSRLSLTADPRGGAWNVELRVFEETWVPLPGGGEIWPENVRANGELVAVVERDGVPAAKLPAGLHQLVGNLQWDEMPQRIAIPKQVGIVSLVVEEQAVPIPNWDAEGNVWLRRLRAEPAGSASALVERNRPKRLGPPSNGQLRPLFPKDGAASRASGATRVSRGAPARAPPRRGRRKWDRSREAARNVRSRGAEGRCPLSKLHPVR